MYTQNGDKGSSLCGNRRFGLWYLVLFICASNMASLIYFFGPLSTMKEDDLGLEKAFEDAAEGIFEGKS